MGQFLAMMSNEFEMETHHSEDHKEIKYRNIESPFCTYWESGNYDYDEYEHELNITN